MTDEQDHAAAPAPENGVDLFRLLAPLPPVRLLNERKQPGRWTQVAPWGAVEYQMWRRINAHLASEESDTLTVDLLRRTLPDASDDERSWLPPEAIIAVFDLAQRKIDEVMRAVGNASEPPQTEHTPSTAATAPVQGRRSRQSSTRAIKSGTS